MKNNFLGTVRSFFFLFILFIPSRSAELRDGVIFDQIGKVELATSVKEIEFYLNFENLLTDVASMSKKIEDSIYKDHFSDEIKEINSKLEHFANEMVNSSKLNQRKSIFHKSLSVSDSEMRKLFWNELNKNKTLEPNTYMFNLWNSKWAIDMKKYTKIAIESYSSDNKKTKDAFKQITADLNIIFDAIEEAKDGICKTNPFIAHLVNIASEKHEKLLFCLYKVNRYSSIESFNMSFRLFFLVTDPSSVLELFQLTPAPNWNRQLEIGVSFKTKFKYLAVTKDRKYYLLLQLLDQCKKNGTNLICSNGSFTLSNAVEDSCEFLLFLNKTERAIAKCPREVYSNRASIEINEDRFTIPVTKELEVSCTDKQSTETVQGVCTIHITGPCYGKLEDHIISPTPGIVSGVQVEYLSVQNTSLFTEEEISWIIKYPEKNPQYFKDNVPIRSPIEGFFMFLRNEYRISQNYGISVAACVIFVFLLLPLAVIVFMIRNYILEKRNNQSRNNPTCSNSTSVATDLNC